ncbi:OBERON-like protein [Cucurbita moschata]|uniref:OBERON-like protein n=1 Tax=Cucurbita moschata TaxID=3662 RepID=A0A6J1FR33_CUCMO|nr:OBERON-like protein [Cucurbita moschata]XP_022942732.1 OBERON-like protein [Cucurbita moschata]XP_022942739.1 OBERON-like protein [Cucurbita moschata]XP_022942746.1 OBERON-like protein [Cucurbita moschata]XP_022942754.1 OBERON-like protein [Cucurbita moschata]XP_022942761.1 OBERON-like protein [Cucurbita moschata]
MSRDPVEPEVLENINCITPKLNKSDLVLRPVSEDEGGEGLPYAPENWPNPGDNWRWRVGKRVAITGHFLDRYLYPPCRLGVPENTSHRGQLLASKLSVERYIQSVNPNVNVDAFFASFCWKIPAKKLASAQGVRGRQDPCPLPSKETKECTASDSQILGCKAGNINCNSLSLVANPSLLKSMSCDICCSESWFCRDCCCILCSKIINMTRKSYSYIKCEAKVGDGDICGHHAHIKCGLKSYMAGTVRGSIGLDAEYYCRRCDARTDLVSHVETFLQLCLSTDCCDDIEEFLGIGFRILRGSRKVRAKELLRHIEVNIAKLKTGTCLEDIWKMDEDISANCTDANGSANSTESSHDTSDSFISSEWTMSTPFDYWTESLKLEDEIEQVLQALKRSQELEYSLAEEKLLLHKNYLHNLFLQLGKEQTELRPRTSSTRQKVFQNNVTNRVDQIKREVKKLKRMEKVADGFGRTPKDILKEDFGFEVD